ncbi:MAG: hypothetical protein AAGA27_06630 [Pseudomonadota bacterium]
MIKQKRATTIPYPTLIYAVLIGSIFVSIPLLSKADNDPNRNVATCIVPRYAEVLGIPTGEPGNAITAKNWRKCFLPVKPSKQGKPSKELQRKNKKAQFACLKELAPKLTNDMVDAVMDSCRPKHKAPENELGNVKSDTPAKNDNPSSMTSN